MRGTFQIDSLEATTEKKKTEEEKCENAFDSKGLSFVKEEGRIKLKQVPKDALLHLLIDPGGFDVDFETTFFFTFPLFFSSEEIIKFLSDWLEVDVESIERRSCQKSEAIKSKAMHLLTHWVRLVPEDFLDASGKILLGRVNTLLISLGSSPVKPVPNSTFAESHVGSKTIGGNSDRTGRRASVVVAPDVATLAVPERKRSLSLKTKGRKGTWSSGDSSVTVPLFRWTPVSIVQQLTIITWKWFESVGPREWLSGSWGGEDMDEGKVPGVFNLVADFNFTHNWVVNEIVQTTNLNDRINVLEILVDSLYECIQLRNYHTAMSIMSSLMSTSVERLGKTWKGISSRGKKNFQAAKDLLSMESNFSALRAITYSAKLPLIPYIGITMGDITGIRQTNMTDSNLINFEQLDVMARVIAHVRHCQTNPYHFKTIPDFVSLLGKKVILDGKGLYERSKELEKGEEFEKEKKKTFSLPFTSIQNDKKEKKEKSKSKEGKTKEPQVLTPFYSSNPFSNRFTGGQLDIMMEFLNSKGSLDPNSEAFTALREKIGKVGQGNLLISKGVILSWLRVQSGND